MPWTEFNITPSVPKDEFLATVIAPFLAASKALKDYKASRN